MEILGFDFVNIFFALIGLMLGLNYPDIDLKTKFLSHRSMVTHSPLLSFILYFFALKADSIELEYFVIGFSLAVAIHLTFDFFPKAWIGNALIKPSLNGITFSKLFILFSIVILYYLSFKLMQGSAEFKLFFILSVAFYSVSAKKEENKLKPLMLFMGMYIFIGNILYPQVFLGLKEKVEEIMLSLLNYIL